MKALSTILCRRRNMVLVGFLLLSIFYVFSRYVKNGGLKQIDFNTTVKIQERIDTSSRLRLADFVGTVMEGSTLFAGPLFSAGVIGVFTLVSLFDIRSRKIRYTALAIPVLFILLVLGELYGKNVVHHPSPPFFMLKNPTAIFPKYYINESYSYPSGHASRAVFIGLTAYGLLCVRSSIQKRKPVNFLIISGILGYICIISLSVLYLGHHWLSDILGGVLLGGGLGLLTLAFISPIIDKQ